MRVKRLLALLLSLLVVQVAAAQSASAPTILSFTSDLASVTPDQAESGVQFTNLSWETANLSANDRLVLQVFVLGEWRDADTGPLPASGTLRWAVPHTLDFEPPRFRLIIRNPNGWILDDALLIIPYTTAIDPQNPPQITLFSTTATTFSQGAIVPVQWAVQNRPAGSNLRFEQVLDSGQTINVDLPRRHQWVISDGTGSVRPVPDGDSINLKVELFDMATGRVYAQQSLGLPATSNPSQPAITAFSTNGLGHKRGDTLKVSWQVERAAAVRLEVYDIDFFPRPYVGASSPLQLFDSLPASGTLDILIPADYAGDGWQVHLIASARNANIPPAIQRIDVLFTDATQPVRLEIRRLDIGAGAVGRGETITIAWDTGVMVRGIDSAGKIAYLPSNAYDNQLWISFAGIADMVVSPGSPFNIKFDSLPLTGSREWQVPDFEPVFTRLLANIGLNVNGQEITYDGRNIELKRTAPTTQTTPAAYQAFERGFMIWLASTGEVRTFTSDGRADTTIESVYSGFTDTSGGATPPEGLLRPQNAFGLVWGGYDFVRTDLGWATSPEQAYTATLEYLPDRTGVLLSLPDGRELYQDGYSWNWP